MIDYPDGLLLHRAKELRNARMMMAEYKSRLEDARARYQAVEAEYAGLLDHLKRSEREFEAVVSGDMTDQSTGARGLQIV